MTAVFRIPAWGWCLACCALAGCCTTQQACSTCTACASNVISDIPSTYENYTPPPQPKLVPLPTPTDEPLTAPPPPPATKYDPNNKMIDYFESATDSRSPSLSR